MLIRRFFAFVISLFFITSAFAADPNDYRQPNTWQRERIINDAVNKSSVKVEASKTYPVSTLDQNGKPIKQMRTAKSTITLGASASNVGKSLFKRTPAIAISYAVTALLGKAVDWVLDPENNSLKYKDSDPYPDWEFFSIDNSICGWGNFSSVYSCSIAEHERLSGKTWTYHPNATVNDIVSSGGDTKIITYIIKTGNANKFVRIKGRLLETPPLEQQWVHIPISDVANQIISDADSGQSPAMQVMADAAIDALETGLLDPQLDSASDIPQPDPQEITQAQYDNPDYPEAGTGSGTDPENPTDPENTFQLPAFCDWASKVCDFIDWYRSEPPEEESPRDVPFATTSDIGIDDTDRFEQRIQFNGQCPVNDFSFSMMGVTYSKPIPYYHLCGFLEQIAPWLLAMTYLGAAYFVTENL